MPIVVDEVVITIEVTGGAPLADAGPTGGTAPQDKQALVSECVERVLEILDRREER